MGEQTPRIMCRSVGDRCQGGRASAEHTSVDRPSDRLFAMQVIAFLLGVFAVVPVLIALGGIVVLAIEDDYGLDKQLIYVSFALAVAAVLPVLLFIRCVRRELLRQAMVWLAVTAVAYLVWAVFEDASVHGWDNLKYFG